MASTKSLANGWSLIRGVIKRKPATILLLELDLGLIIMADLFQFVLVLVAVAYSTWIILPWAFYKELKARKAWKQIGWLRLAEVLLFVSGTFFVFYVMVDLYITTAQNLEPLLAFVLPIMRAILLLVGSITLLSGLYESFRVVNYYSGAKEAMHSLTYWGLIPFYAFDIIMMIVIFASFAYEYSIVKEMTIVGWFFTVSACLTILGMATGIFWQEHVIELAKRPNLKGFVALAMVVLPIILLVLLYVLGSAGVRFF